MNSSGIKRGLATTAVSALAVSGIPFIASSASAAPGDAISVVSVSPVRNGGDLGVDVQVKLTGTTAAELELANTALTDGGDGAADSSAQTIGDGTNEDVLADQTLRDYTVTAIPNGTTLDSNKTDGLDEAIFNIEVGTTNAGDSFAFAIFGDDDGDDIVDGTEARTQVTGVTSGAPDTIDITPGFQTAPVDTPSGNYNYTLKDAGGRTTQLTGAEELRFSKASGPSIGGVPSVVTFNPTGPVQPADVGTDGKASFTAEGDQQGTYVLNVGYFLTDVAATAAKNATARLDVAGQQAATNSIVPQEIDVITGADDRDGFGNPGTSATVRPDQSSVTFAFRDLSQANNVVTVTATGAGVTFGGAGTQTRTVTLNANGEGSVTFNVDAASIQSGESFTVDGDALDSAIDINYEAVAPDSVDADQTTYISSFGGTVNPVVTVKDQFGNPVSGVFVTYELEGGENDTNTQSARVATDANGQVTFAITDTKASAGNTDPDTIRFRVYDGQFDATVLAQDAGSTIVYTADGQGSDFLLTVDGQTPGSAAYNPVINPLTDTVLGNGGPVDDSTDEGAVLDILGGTSGAGVTVTADNGGLVLKGSDDDLAQAAASKTGVVGDDFTIVGTQAGTVNVTVTSGGKTETATVAVETLAEYVPVIGPNNTSADTARNIAVSGPESVVAGDVVEFTVVITDAFGNPVQGFSPNGVTTLLTGPAQVKGNSGASNAAGEIVYTVELDQDARNPITLQVTGNGADFGAAADKLDAATPTPTPGVGLTASVQTASASADVVNIEELEQAVADAEAELASAEADLAEAQTDLDVAQTQLAIAQSEVDRLQERKQNLRQKLNKAKRNDNKQKAKTTRKKLRNVKSQLNDAKDAVVVAQSRVDGEQNVVDLRQEQVTAAEEALAEAQADLDEAQN